MKNVSVMRLISEIGIFAAIGYVLDEIQGAYSIAFVNGGSIGIAITFSILSIIAFLVCIKKTKFDKNAIKIILKKETEIF